MGAVAARPAAGRGPAGVAKAVLFDLLSALLDSWSLWDDIAGGEGPGRKWRFEYLRRTYATGAYVPYLDLVGDSAAAVGLPRELSRTLEARWDELAPWPGVGRVLREIARDRPVGVATNCSEVLGQRAAELVGAPFSAVVTAETAGCYKPDPRIYLAGVEALGARVDDVLFVAGSPLDVEGATEAGMRVVWHNPAGLAGRAAERVAVGVLRDLASLPAWLAARGQNPPGIRAAMHPG
ncbi:MAG: HAD-IA family hydrolase [Gemmatimonadota bacterium]|nr:HAD-IA family hydrolase [Gemmatimonadota bacterium]MDE2677934.1 HAD-IA family hydrolase [Gemmatimonadota bacterium]MYD14243.1 HAD-IA family hydrolase [Gemmatimonadota bacterium]